MKIGHSPDAPELPLEDVETAGELQDTVLALCDAMPSKIVINALVNALAAVYADAMVHGDYPKERVLKHLSAAIDFHYASTEKPNAN